MVRTVWDLIQGTRRLYLVDDTCTFLEPVKRYLEALDIQGKSPNTLESYCRHLKHYFTFLEEAHLDWRAVTPDDLLRFVEWLRNPHCQLQMHPFHLTSRLSERSVNTILAAVASFYRYHVQRRQVLANPVLYEEVSNRFSRFKPFLVHTSRGKMTRRGLKLKEPQRRIRPIGDEAFAHFQDATSNLQFQCILLLMRDGGLRVGEVLGLHIQDLEFHRNGVVIRRRAGLANGALAKGMVDREERFVELTQQVMALLDHLVLQHTFQTDQVFVVLNKQARNRQGNRPTARRSPAMPSRPCSATTATRLASRCTLTCCATRMPPNSSGLAGMPATSRCDSAMPTCRPPSTPTSIWMTLI